MDKIKWDTRNDMIIEGIFHYNSWLPKIIPRIRAITFGRHVYCQYRRAKVIREISDYTSGGMHLLLIGNYELIKHNLIHVMQYQNWGFFKFLAIYVWEWIRYGFRYKRIHFEIDARQLIEGKRLGVVYVKAVE